MAGARIQLKRGTAAAWAAANTVLFAGEIGYETDTTKFKTGDGTTAWNSLAYSFVPLSVSTLNDLGDVTIVSAADGDFLRWDGTAWINDAVNLSTDTIGSYVESLVAGTGVTLSNNSGEGATPTVAIGQDVSTSATVEFGALTVNGQTTVGGHVLPDENETFDLGSASSRFRDIYLSGTTIDLGGAQITSDGTEIAFSGGISVGGGANLVGDLTGNADTATTLQTARNIAGQSFDGSANISIAPTDLTGVTSTAAELNILAGATLSTTELNYVDGVTSAVQTQIDTKAPLDSPTLTGTPTLPTGTIATTQTAGDNSTAVATTAFVSTAVSNLVDTAPEALNTLNELAAALGDDENFATTTATNLGLKAPIASPTFTGTVTVPAPSNDTDASTKAYVDTTASNTASNAATALSNHEADTTNVHGIADTSILVTTTGSQTLTNKTITTPSGLVKNDVGLGNVDNTSDVNKPVSTAGQTALDLKANLASPTFTGTVTVPTPTNNTDAATKAYVDSTASTTSGTASTALTNHEADTTNIHGIADTSILVTTTGSQTLTNKTITSPSGLVKGDVGLGNADNTSDANKPVSTATQTALDLKANLASPTFTGTVTIPTGASITAPTGLVKGDVGLGNVDNTSDVNKPVSTDTQTALDLKADLASPTFTGTPTLPTGTIAVTQTAGNNSTAVATTAYVETAVSNLVDTAPAALNTLNELAAALGDDENFAATTATNLGLKAPLDSPTFTGTVTIPTGASITAPTGLVKGDVGLGNVDNTSDANKPVSTAAQTALDLKAPLASPTFTGTVTIPTGASITAPTGLVKDDVGLGNVDNTSDANKPVSTAQQTALDLKADLASPTFTGTVSGITSTMVGLGNVDNTSNATERAATATLTNKTLTSPVINTPTGIVKGDVGLGNVDNTSDANKPVSTAAQTALDLKAPLASPTFTGTVAGITATMVGLGNVDNTSDANKPVSTAQQTALDLKAPLASPTFTGTVTVPNPATDTDAATKLYVDSTVSGASISSLDDIGDVTITAAANGDYLKWNGTAFVNDDIDLGTDTVGDYVATITGGTGVTSSAATSGEGTTHTLSIGQAVGTSDNVTFAGVTADNIKVGVTGANEIDTVSGDLTIDSAGGTVTVDDNLTVTGNLTVSGTTTSINTETLTVDDNIIVLNNNATGAPSANAGIEIERGSSTNVELRWNETNDKWELTADGAAYADIATETYADAVVTAARIITAAGGDGTAGQALTTNGSGTLDFTTITGTTEASIISAVGGDGTSGQVLKTDGSGDLSFGDLSLDDLSDVNAIATDGDYLRHNGTEWINAVVTFTDILDESSIYGNDLGDVLYYDGSNWTNMLLNLNKILEADSIYPAAGDFLKYDGSLWAASTIELGTDTTGNYMAGVSAGDGITVTHTAGEGSTATISARDTLVRFYMEVI